MTSTVPPTDQSQAQIDLAGLETKQQDLAQAMNQVQGVVDEMKGLLGAIVAYNPDDPAFVQLADSVNERIGWLRKVARRGDSVAAGAVAGLKEAMQTRDALAGELQTITQAVKMRDRSDPRIKRLVEYLESDIADSMAWQFEEQEEFLSRMLQDELGLSSCIADNAASEIKELLFGDYAWTEPQKAAIAALVETFKDNHDWWDPEEGQGDDED